MSSPVLEAPISSQRRPPAAEPQGVAIAGGTLTSGRRRGNKSARGSSMAGGGGTGRPTGQQQSRNRGGQAGGRQSGGGANTAYHQKTCEQEVRISRQQAALANDPRVQASIQKQRELNAIMYHGSADKPVGRKAQNIYEVLEPYGYSRDDAVKIVEQWSHDEATMEAHVSCLIEDALARNEDQEWQPANKQKSKRTSADNSVARQPPGAPAAGPIGRASQGLRGAGPRSGAGRGGERNRNARGPGVRSKVATAATEQGSNPAMDSTTRPTTGVAAPMSESDEPAASTAAVRVSGGVKQSLPEATAPSSASGLEIPSTCGSPLPRFVDKGTTWAAMLRNKDNRRAGQQQPEQPTTQPAPIVSTPGEAYDSAATVGSTTGAVPNISEAPVAEEAQPVAEAPATSIPDSTREILSKESEQQEADSKKAVIEPASEVTEPTTAGEPPLEQTAHGVKPFNQQRVEPSTTVKSVSTAPTDHDQHETQPTVASVSETKQTIESAIPPRSATESSAVAPPTEPSDASPMTDSGVAAQRTPSPARDSVHREVSAGPTGLGQTKKNAAALPTVQMPTVWMPSDIGAFPRTVGSIVPAAPADPNAPSVVLPAYVERTSSHGSPLGKGSPSAGGMPLCFGTFGISSNAAAAALAVPTGGAAISSVPATVTACVAPAAALPQHRAAVPSQPKHLPLTTGEEPKLVPPALGAPPVTLDSSSPRHSDGSSNIQPVVGSAIGVPSISSYSGYNVAQSGATTTQQRGIDDPQQQQSHQAEIQMCHQHMLLSTASDSVIPHPHQHPAVMATTSVQPQHQCHQRSVYHPHQQPPQASANSAAAAALAIHASSATQQQQHSGTVPSAATATAVHYGSYPLQHQSHHKQPQPQAITTAIQQSQSQQSPLRGLPPTSNLMTGFQTTAQPPSGYYGSTAAAPGQRDSMTADYGMTPAAAADGSTTAWATSYGLPMFADYGATAAPTANPNATPYGYALPMVLSGGGAEQHGAATGQQHQVTSNAAAAAVAANGTGCRKSFDMHSDVAMRAAAGGSAAADFMFGRPGSAAGGIDSYPPGLGSAPKYGQIAHSTTATVRNNPMGPFGPATTAVSGWHMPAAPTTMRQHPQQSAARVDKVPHHHQQHQQQQQTAGGWMSCITAADHHSNSSLQAVPAAGYSSGMQARAPMYAAAPPMYSMPAPYAGYNHYSALQVDSAADDLSRSAVAAAANTHWSVDYSRAVQTAALSFRTDHLGYGTHHSGRGDIGAVSATTGCYGDASDLLKSFNTGHHQSHSQQPKNAHHPHQQQQPSRLTGL